MTYPQGPYGQQPDPYGQQQPQYGGYQQQPQYGGAYDPNANAQYGGAYGQQYGGFGGGPQPPKNNKGPIIAIVSIVVLILAGVGITGFVAPGFFLSDDKGGNTASDSGTSTAGGDNKDDASGADAFISKMVAAADSKSESKLEDYQCSNATDSVKDATKHIDEIDSAELKDTREESDTEVVAKLNIVVDGDDGDYEATVVKDGGDWCWKDFTGGKTSSSDESSSESTTDETSESGAPGGGGGDSDGVEFVQSFLDKLNAGDGAGANQLSCADSTSQQDITNAAAGHPSLQIDQSGLTADSTYVGAPLTGTVNGQSVTARTSAFVEDGKWCIYTFFAY
jgi:hypothetical protein